MFPDLLEMFLDRQMNLRFYRQFPNNVP
jgi:hypothetical protein